MHDKRDAASFRTRSLERHSRLAPRLWLPSLSRYLVSGLNNQWRLALPVERNAITQRRIDDKLRQMIHERSDRHAVDLASE